MFLAKTTSEIRTFLDPYHRANAPIGFVPTMGYLHEGHLALVDIARQRGEPVVVSIFVNPTQFNNPSDLEKYPRDIARDLALLEERKVQAVFLPSNDQIYTPHFSSWITPALVAQPLEGAFRPGHFQGVTTVVSILFNVVRPTFAVFGEKDFQQVRVIEEMVRELQQPIEIVRAPIIREKDGLAMSSRNVRLAAEARTAALLLSRGLLAAHSAYQNGVKDGNTLCQIVAQQLAQSTLITAEYIAVCNENDLQECSIVEPPARLFVAAVVDGIRLIDNIALE